MERGRSFDRAAAEYAAVRPDYPSAAIDWLLPPDARRVLDLGAGTGKLTRQLVDWTNPSDGPPLEVVAVEPSPQMCAELSAHVPEAELHEGAAEAIPLPDASVDAVLAGQAFHWFDQDRALPEIARVLRPGGRLGLLWNLGDDSEPWLKALAERTEAIAQAGRRGPAVGELAGFADATTAEFAHRVASGPAALRRLVQTNSAYLVADDAARRDLLSRIDEVVSTHPDLAGRQSFDLPYVTVCWRGTRI